MSLMQGRMSHLLLGFAMSCVAHAEGLAPDRCAATFKAGDFRGARACYETILKHSPDNEGANLGAGTLALYANDLDSAARYLKRAQGRGLDDARVARLLVQVQARRPAPGQYQVEMGTDPTRVPFMATDPLPILKVRVNGARDAYFSLDTGAGPVVLNSQFASELGIKAQDAFIGTFAGGKHAPVQLATLDSITLGGATITNLPVNVSRNRSKLGKGIQIDGVIGTALLGRFLATIDYVHGALVLRPRSDSAAFEAHAARSGATRVPLWLVGDHFLFARGRLGDAPEGLFSVDTGCAGCGVTATDAALKAAHITPDAAHAFRGQGGGGAVMALPFTADVTLGSVTEHALRGFYTPHGSPYGIFPFEVQGAISHGFFRPYALTLDFDAMLLVMQR
jgi:Aspartyl protease/Tetratricopeptide repeat